MIEENRKEEVFHYMSSFTIPEPLVNATVRARKAIIEFKGELRKFLQEQQGDESKPLTEDDTQSLEELSHLEDLLQALAKGMKPDLIKERLHLQDLSGLENLGFPKGFLKEEV
jgi:hypothetical protein